MAFTRSGRLNGVAKRSQGTEILTVATDIVENSLIGEGVFNIFQSLPGTGVLTNTGGPRGYFIPYSLGTSGQYKTSISPSGTYLVNISGSYPYAVIYKKVNGLWTLLNTTFMSSYGLTALSVAWSANESLLAIGTATGGTYNIYTFTKSGDTFTFNAGILAGSSNMTTMSFDSTGNYFAAGNQASPFVYIYSISSNTFTKIANPATLPNGAVNSLSWSSNNNLLACAGNLSPFINVYSYSGSGTSTVFTKLVNPNTLPSGNMFGVAFNNTSTGAINTLSLAMTGGSQALVYNLNLAGASTTFVNTTTLSSPTAGYDITWNSDGTSVFYTGGAGTAGAQFVWGYNRSGVNTYTTITNIVNTASITGFTSIIGSAIIWTTTTNHLTLAYDANPGITEFSRSGDTFTDVDCWGRLAQGYGSQSYVIASAAETMGRWNPGGSNYPGTILATTQASALVPFYYNINGGTYTQITTVFTATTVGTIQDIAWSPNGQILTVYGGTSPYIANYYVSGVGTSTTFTKLASPVSLVPIPSGGNAGQLAWSPDSSILMVAGSNTSPYIGWYSVTGTGISTTFTLGSSANFTTTVSAGVGGSSISPDGNYLALQGGGNTLRIFSISYNGTATTFSSNGITIGSQPSQVITKLAWSPNGQYLAGARNAGATTQNLYVYQRTGNTFTNVTPSVSSLNANMSTPVWSADSSRVYAFSESTLALTANTWPGISMLTKSNTTSTWVYTTATTANIDLPTQSYYNIDIKYDL